MTGSRVFSRLRRQHLLPEVFSRAVHDQLTALPPAENFSGEMTLGVVETYPGRAERSS
jgi:hypothetical protein